MRLVMPHCGYIGRRRKAGHRLIIRNPSAEYRRHHSRNIRPDALRLNVAEPAKAHGGAQKPHAENMGGGGGGFRPRKAGLLPHETLHNGQMTVRLALRYQALVFDRICGPKAGMRPKKSAPVPARPLAKRLRQAKDMIFPVDRNDPIEIRRATIGMRQGNPVAGTPSVFQLTNYKFGYGIRSRNPAVGKKGFQAP
jgi:hypothetical protein